jgi:hypothetical protein
MLRVVAVWQVNFPMGLGDHSWSQLTMLLLGDSLLLCALHMSSRGESSSN